MTLELVVLALQVWSWWLWHYDSRADGAGAMNLELMVLEL